jgi:hypothetical protein
MKLALEALTRIWEDGLENFPESEHDAAITALRTAIEQADDQEAWKSSDTAYRPDGLPQDFTKHEVENEGDWSEWVCPDPEQYFMKCCDCGLVHKMQFKVVKYSAGDKCEDFDDPYVQAVFRARRTTPPAAPVQEPVAWQGVHDQTDLYYRKPPQADVRPLYTTPPAAQRQPLTDEEIDDIWNRYCDEMGEASINDAYDIARAIEAAHGITGEKNT